jgi:hypothetical protein
MDLVIFADPHVQDLFIWQNPTKTPVVFIQGGVFAAGPFAAQLR